MLSLFLEFFLQQSSDSLNLIISDQFMRDYDGLSLLRTCRSVGLDIPFLLITADPNKDLVVKARAMKVSGFLAKPLNMYELVQKAKDLIYIKNNAS